MRLLVAFAVVVVTGSIGAALYFGERSPIIAEGTIKLPASLTQQAQGMRTLYVIVRDAKSPMPMPWGALSTTLSADPVGDIYKFTLTRDNLRVMAQSQEPPETIIVKARLDMDGMGGSDMPGDIVGVSGPVNFGSANVVIELNELIAESTPPTAGP